MAKSKKTKKKVDSKSKKPPKSKVATKNEVEVDEKKVKLIATRIVKYAKLKSQKNKKTDNFPLWYAGIANKPTIRIVGHKSKLKIKDLPTFKPFDAKTYVTARAVEKYLCDNHQFQHCEREGGPNKDNHESPSKFTYVYFIPSELRKK